MRLIFVAVRQVREVGEGWAVVAMVAMVVVVGDGGGCGARAGVGVGVGVPVVVGEGFKDAGWAGSIC